MIDQKPMQTIHIYYEQEDPTPPKPYAAVWIILAGCFVLGCLISVSVLAKPPLETRVVPAHFLPPRYYSVKETIIPTGIKTYPATYATGTLTLYNGSFLSEQIPQGLILTTLNGIEVTTDESVIVPAGNPPTYGMATVSVHALVAGTKGNIPANAITQIYGSFLYIRNLTPFTGGRNAYVVKVITQHDRANALFIARAILSSRVSQVMLDHPCRESFQTATLTWTCQYVTYTSPVFFQVKGMVIAGKTIVLYGYPVMRPRTIEFK